MIFFSNICPVGCRWEVKTLILVCILSLAKLDLYSISHLFCFASTTGSHKGQPIQLISPNAYHTKLLLNEEGLSQLEKLEAPISVITAVGSIHTGKSFLLNQLMGRTDGFKVEYTVKPGTQGIWMWSEPIQYEDTQIILLDTEGFHGPNVTKSYDQILYALSFLLSSEVIFTTNRMMDGRDLEYLEELTKDANLFALRTHAKLASSFSSNPIEKNDMEHDEDPNEESEYSNTAIHSFPEVSPSAIIVNTLSPSSLSWVIMNFIQDLQGQEPINWLNNLIDATRRNVPIQQVVNTQTDKPQNLEKGNNKIEKEDAAPYSYSLRQLYSQIDCATLPSPASSENIQQLDTLNVFDLEEEFRNSLNEFKIRLFQRAQSNPKRKGHVLKNALFQSKTSTTTNDNQSLLFGAMSGADLSSLLRFLVQAANENFIADIDKFMEHFRRVRAEMVKNDLLQLYDADMSTYLSILPPLLLSDLQAYHDEIRYTILEMWKQHNLGDVDKEWAPTILAELEQKVAAQKLIHFTQGENAIKEYCYRKCQSFLQKLEMDASDEKKNFPQTEQELNAYISIQNGRFDGLLPSLINVEGRDYIHSPGCHTIITECKGNVTILHEEHRKLNRIAIQSQMEKAIHAASEKFTSLLHSKQNLMHIQSEWKDFQATLFTWKLAAQEAFKHVAGNLADMEQNEFKKWEEKYLMEMQKPENLAEELWRQKCKEKCHDTIQHLTQNIKFNLEESINFPIEEETLQNMMEEQKDTAIHEMRSVYCVDSIPWKEMNNVMMASLNEIYEHLESKNIEAIKVNCREPLQELISMLSSDAVSYYVWSRFENFAKQRAIQTLRKRVGESIFNDVSLSENLIQKVTHRWAETDLVKAYKKKIQSNMASLISNIFGSIVLIFGTYLLKFSRRIYTGLIVIILGILQCFGIQQVATLFRSFLRWSVVYTWEGLSTALGFEVAFVTVILTIGVASVFLFLKFSVRFFYRHARNSEPPILPQPSPNMRQSRNTATSFQGANDLMSDFDKNRVISASGFRTSAYPYFTSHDGGASNSQSHGQNLLFSHSQEAKSQPTTCEPSYNSSTSNFPKHLGVNLKNSNQALDYSQRNQNAGDLSNFYNSQMH